MVVLGKLGESGAGTASIFLQQDVEDVELGGDIEPSNLLPGGGIVCELVTGHGDRMGFGHRMSAFAGHSGVAIESGIVR